MKIPFKYNLRSMWARRVGTLMTAAGVGLTVAIVIVMMAMVVGLTSAFVDSGHDNQLIVVRKGSLNEVNSYFGRDLYQTVRYLPGIDRDEEDQPLASPEIIVVINWPRASGEDTNVTMRGIGEKGFELRPEMKIVGGRRFEPGVREIIASRSISERFHGFQLGQQVQINDAPWKVVGIFDAGGTAYDSEIMSSYSDIAQEWERPIYSSILLRVDDPDDRQAIIKRIEDDENIQLQAVPQDEYFADQTSSAGPVVVLGTFVAVLMGVGACFAAMNMMYATIMSRVKEVATLRALGFKRRSILSSFLLESIVLTLLAGIVGGLMALPMNGITTGTANMGPNGSFAEVIFQFRISPPVLLAGLIFSLGVGIVGGFLPALRAARVRLVDALRD
ncbi:MAG TPA: ABC transporter permease [Acidobacteriota bacterium]|nr:ABC transporter permease [Acidobacteriota bacterium]